MSGIQRIEDLIAWQKSRRLTKAIYGATRTGLFARDFGLAGQIQRASVSVMANIAEGFERGRSTEFHQFRSTAKASCAQVRSHLYAALDAGYLEQTEFEDLLSRTEEVSRLVGGPRAAVERRKSMSRVEGGTQHSSPSTQN